MIDAAGPTETVNEAEGVASQARGVYDPRVLFVWTDVLFYTCLISMYAVTFTYGRQASVCVCGWVCFTVHGVCRCATRYATWTNMVLRQGGQA